MAIDIDSDNLKDGLLGLLVSLVEIIRDVLRIEAVKRLEAGSLTDDEVERLGRSLLELDAAVTQLKEEHDLGEIVQSTRESLDSLVDDIFYSVVE